MKKVNSVSVNQSSHNRDYDEITHAEAIFDGDSIVIFGKVYPVIIGCFWYDSDGLYHCCYCKECRAFFCPDDFVCNLDFSDGTLPIYKED